MIKKFALPAAIAGTLLAGSAVQAASIVNLVDPLTDVQEAFINMPASPDVTQPPDVKVSGGLLDGVTRSMMLKVVTNNGNKSNSRVPASSKIDHGFSLSNDVEQEADVILDYSTFPAPVDFTVGGADRFIVTFMTNDQEENLASLKIDGVTIKLENPILPVLPVDSENVDIELLFSDFAGVDFTKVTSLELQLDTVLEGDMAVSMFATGKDISTTPEPATMLSLLAVGALGFASRRRQK